MSVKQRFAIGLKWVLERPGFNREYEIIDVYKTFNSKDELIKLRYVCKSSLSTNYDVVDATIARALKDGLKDSIL